MRDDRTSPGRGGTGRMSVCCCRMAAGSVAPPDSVLLVVVALAQHEQVADEAGGLRLNFIEAQARGQSVVEDGPPREPAGGAFFLSSVSTTSSSASGSGRSVSMRMPSDTASETA